MNSLTLHFRCTDCNGLPQAKIFLNQQLIHDHKFLSVEESLSISVDESVGDHVLTIERHSKTEKNCVYTDGKIIQDQILEIVKITVDDTEIPAYALDSYCEFAWSDRIDPGSRYFGPNGTWTFRFSTPIITYILDTRINHESRYNQDYQFPWSYKHGPDSVQEILDTIKQVEKRVNEIL